MVADITKFEKWAEENKVQLKKDRRNGALQFLIFMGGYISIFPIVLLFVFLSNFFGEWLLVLIPFTFIIVIIISFVMIAKLYIKLTFGQQLALMIYRLYQHANMQGVNERKDCKEDLKLLNRIIWRPKRSKDYTPWTPRRKEEEEFKNNLREFIRKFYHAYINGKTNHLNLQEIKNLAYNIFNEDSRMFDEVKKLNKYPEEASLPNIFDFFKKIKAYNSSTWLSIIIEMGIVLIFILLHYINPFINSEV